MVQRGRRKSRAERRQLRKVVKLNTGKTTGFGQLKRGYKEKTYQDENESLEQGPGELKQGPKWAHTQGKVPELH